MKDKDIEKALSGIWAKAEKTYGVEIPRNFRKFLENKMLTGSHSDTELELKDLEDEIAPALIMVAEWDKSKAIESAGNLRQSDKELGDITTNRKYGKSFKKRLRLVKFVATPNLGMDEVKSQTFKSRKRIDWKLMSAKWNKVNPHNTKSPEVLKAQYYQAIREDDMRREYFRIQIAAFKLAFRPLADRMEAFQKAAHEATEVFKESLRQVVKCFEYYQPLGWEVDHAIQSLDDLYRSEKRSLLEFQHSHSHRNGGER